MEGCTVSSHSPYYILVAVLGVLVFFSSMKTCSVAAATNTYNTEFIRTSCATTMYPNLCLKSLSSYSTKIKTSYKKLAYAALSVSLKRARSTSSMVSKLSRRNMKPNEAAALKDCVENIGDSIDELRESLREIKYLNVTDLDYEMSNIKTWVSAALSDDDTCTDGLDEESVTGEVKNTIRESVVNVAQLTSNALDLVNSLNATRVNSP